MAKRTQKAIIGAFVEQLKQKPLDKITVMDICENSGVSRSTFYYHYRDIYDLMDSMVRSDVERVSQADFDLDTWYDTLAGVMAVIGQNKTLVNHVCEGLSHESLTSYLFTIADALFGCLARQMAQKHTGVSEEDIKSSVQVMSATFVGLMFGWLNNGFSQGTFGEYIDIKKMFNDYLNYAFAAFPLCSE